MASKTQKQLALLGVLAIAFVGVMLRGGGDSPAGAPSPSNRVAGAAGPGQQNQKPGSNEVVDVQLDLLKAGREEPPASERNLFRFQEKATAPPPSRGEAPPSREVPSNGPLVPSGPPPPPPIPLRFIGYVNAPTQAGRIAIMSDGRGYTFQGREGDIIEGRYRLLRIGADNIEMAYTDGRGRQLIRLAGQ